MGKWLGNTPISIHAPANGATYPHRTSLSYDDNFNPRSGERSDLKRVKNQLELLISIHAPANGATLEESIDAVNAINFNPRSGERSDGVHDLDQRLLDKFQSTLRRTERQSTCRYARSWARFQSTLRRTERR